MTASTPTATDGETGRAAASARSPRSPHASSARRRALGLAGLVAALGLVGIASLAFGSNPMTPAQAWDGLLARDDSEASLVVWSLRVPRTLAGVMVGAAFGVAGALIQAVTRNPLADTGILGVNAGAGFAVTLGVGVFGITGVSGYVWYAFLGAAAATVLVYLIGSAGGGRASPVTLVLAGVALGAVLGGISAFMTLMDPDTFRALRRWGVGSIARITPEEIASVLPFVVAGLVIALALTRSLNSTALGDDVAVSHGTRPGVTRAWGVVAVTLLAGAGTAVTGGIGFVGLMVPHVVRWITGPDQRWIMAYSALGAPVLVLAADVVGRVVGSPGEVEVGIVTAVVGAPVLIALARGRRASTL